MERRDFNKFLTLIPFINIPAIKEEPYWCAWNGDPSKMKIPTKEDIYNKIEAIYGD